jgi:hypothetical protein
MYSMLISMNILLVHMVHMVHNGPWSKEEIKKRTERREKEEILCFMVSRCLMGTFTVITMTDSQIATTTSVMKTLDSHACSFVQDFAFSIRREIEKGAFDPSGKDIKIMTEAGIPMMVAMVEKKIAFNIQIKDWVAKQTPKTVAKQTPKTIKTKTPKKAKK